MNDRVRENIMILGITGSGKSTLINYLFGEERLKTGTGKPVTKKTGFLCTTISSPLKKDVDLNIYDSWGLEADKAEEWKQLIQEKLTANYDFAKIMHSIVYCIPYANDRIQEFEIDLLNEMLKTGYGIIIAFTKADNRSYEDKKKLFRKILSGEKGIKQKYQNRYITVDICAKPVKKIGQESIIEPFGRDDLLREIERSVFKNFFEVVLSVWRKWRKESLRKVDETEIQINSRIKQFYITVRDAEDFFRMMTTTKTKRAKELADLIKSDLDELIKEMFSNIKKSTKKNYLFYMKITGSMYPVTSGKNKASDDLKADLSGMYWTDGSFKAAITVFLMECIPLIGLFVIAMEKDLLQDELKSILRKNIDTIKKKINAYYSQETALFRGGL